MSGSDGKIMAAQYQPSFLKNQVIYAQIFPPEQPDRSYTWTSRKRWVNLKDIDYPYLSSLSQPNGRVLKLEYDGGDSYGIPRVASLSSPVGKDSAPLVTHRFFYHHQNSYVLDIDGNKTSYAWNGEDRLTSICKFIGTDHRHSEERFVWNKTFLTCKSFFDQNKKCLHARTLTYDDWGNVTKNTLHGNLSGQGSDLQLSANQMPLPGSESCSTHSVYSQDGKNLPLRIEDPNGCPTSQGSTKYFYDALDRLIQIATPTCIQLFGYDSFHRCLYKVVIQESGEKTLYFLYDGQKEIGSFDPLQKILELRILGFTPEAERGAAIAVELDKKVFAPLHDLQGNLTALIPIDGLTPSFYRYSAFGEEKIYGPTLSPWRFSSKRSDAETKLVYYGRRFYMSNLGRWLTPDPAGFTDGMNLYAFLQNDPLMKMDLYGLFAWGSGSTRDFSQNYSWNRTSRPAYADYGSSSWSAPFLAKGPSSSSATSPAPYRSKIFPPLDPNSIGSPHYVVNGIKNNPDECMESALGIHESCKKISNVIPVYSATAGALKDLYTVMQCRYNRSYTNEFIEMFRGEIISVATEMDRRKDDRKIFISAFSRAVGETFFVVKDLPLEVKNRLIITCCGGVLVMPRDCGFIVRNYISEGDWPSRKLNGLRGDPEKIKEMLEMHNEHADLTMLPQEDSNGLGDHFSQSKAYQKIRGKDTFGLYQEYGISK